MKTFPTHIDTNERNRLIDDFLSAANGEEVHYTDIAWFLQLDPFYVNSWMRKYNTGKWINGRNRSWWKLFPEKVPDSFGYAKMTSLSHD
ncbi:hypothetical protein [uncultured Gimesia sp.]|uniref:hypothetical protein n=1 Tax=uncultured Gimesia sp. TaxID=1678688 RepID=UPI00260A3296|nr:hypothetical protein [uncultured Gimesia sp.]